MYRCCGAQLDVYGVLMTSISLEQLTLVACRRNRSPGGLYESELRG